MMFLVCLQHYNTQKRLVLFTFGWEVSLFCLAINKFTSFCSRQPYFLLPCVYNICNITKAYQTIVMDKIRQMLDVLFGNLIMIWQMSQFSQADVPNQMEYPVVIVQKQIAFMNTNLHIHIYRRVEVHVVQMSAGIVSKMPIINGND